MIVSKHNNVSRLTFISEEPSKNGHKMNKYLCSCGNYCVCRESGYRTGNTLSCGCLNTETRRLLGKSFITFGIKDNELQSEYWIYNHMKRRCYYKKDAKYKNYGARGISVCERWLKSFKNFLDDMGRKPSSIHSIDRIDVNGNYEPLNCRWATPDIQGSNKTNTVYYEVFGERIHQAEFARRLGVCPKSIEWQRKNNKTPQQIIDYFSKKQKAYAYPVRSTN